MKLATPRWWYRRHGASMPMSRLILTPASWLWAAATARRLSAAEPADPGAPVVCVGNLTLGGSGKTPVAREVARRLVADGRRAQVLLRGYGGSLAGPIRVDLDMHSAAEVGDEALMLARRPAGVGRAGPGGRGAGRGRGRGGGGGDGRRSPKPLAAQDAVAGGRRRRDPRRHMAVRRWPGVSGRADA